MKKLRTKKRINNKKGISMVLAIALVAVLFLTTTSFLSIAMLQQSETGTTLNSRQAYVSSKSALDIAQEFLNDGKLTLPSEDNSKYYVFYYLNGDPDIKFEDCSSAAEALQWIKDRIGNNDYTIIGNAYVKITNNGGNNYTITAVGFEEKYNNTNGGNTGDISVNVKITDSLIAEPSSEEVTMYQKKIPNTPPDGENKFLMLGDQTAFSLVKSAYSKHYNKLTYGTSHGSQVQPYYLFRTFNKSSKEENADGKYIIYEPQVEAEAAPITSYFPIVFDKVVKINSEGDDRCKYTAYNNGIYLLGNYSGSEVKSGNKYPNLANVCYYTNDGTYGATLECAYLVIGGNMACRPKDNTKTGAYVKYSGPDLSRSDDYGVVVNFTTTCTLSKYYQNGSSTNETYAPGYYFIKTGKTGKVDLFASDVLEYIDINNSSDPNYDKYLRIKDIDAYSSMCETDGSLKNMHSAFEAEANTGVAKVTILNSDGTFNTPTGGNKTYQTNESTISNSNYETGYDNYYIYCAPSEMPSTAGYYYMYSGKAFNYLWYNVDAMEINKNVNMTIQSDNIVLSIGPDQGEKVYYYENNQDSVGTKVCNDLSKNKINFNGTEPAPTKTYTSTGTNKIVQKDSSASFSIKPYWNGGTFTLMVMNDIGVRFYNEDPNKEVTYTIKAGTYESGNEDNNIPLSGFDLFSNDAKNYFENHTVETEDATKASINWVKSDNTINDNPTFDQGTKAISFKATAGGTLAAGTYKAKAIFCDFGTSTVQGNGATLKADIVSINAKRIEYSGDGLTINTSSGYNETDGSRCKLTTGVKPGCMLHITRNEGTTLKLKSGIEFKLNEGYYYFPDKNEFNILVDNDWTSTKYYYVKELETKTTTDNTYTVKKITVVDDFEGKYF